jgi:hypothetical protein
MRRLRLALAALLCAALAAHAPRLANAAVHPYAGGRFTPLGDAFVFRGGREGLYRSRSEARARVPPRRARCAAGIAPVPLALSS